MKLKYAGLALVIFVGACDNGGEEAEKPEPEAWVPPPYVMGEHIPDYIRAAVEHPERPDEDKVRDGGRKPGDVLAFAGLKPGMTALDLVSSSGYYAEVLSRAVGEKGKVIAHNTEWMIKEYYSEPIAKRYEDDRLANTEFYVAEFNDIDLLEGSVDFAILGLNYHDIYWVPKPDSEFVWLPIDQEKFLANIYRALKPGGIFVIVDHEAPESLGTEAGGTLHRISSAIVKAQMQDAGFELTGESDALRNPDDDHSLNVFHPDIRGRTDRFVLVFRKPA